MSYELSGPVGFANQGASAKAMRTFGRHLLTDGVVKGCSVTYNGGMSVSISSGYVMLAGGEVHNVSAQTLGLTQSSGYARIILNADMSKAATTSEFKQVFFSVDYASTVGGFSALTQQDINASGRLYQYSFAVLHIGTGVEIAPTAAREVGYVKELWSGALFPVAASLYFSETVSAQPHGIVLVFSRWNNDEEVPFDYGWQFVFVPKQFVASYPGVESFFMLGNADYDYLCGKVISIYNDHLVGDAKNGRSGFVSDIGIASVPRRYVLRKVYGV